MPDPVIQLSICVIDFFSLFVEFHLSSTFLWNEGERERKEGRPRGQSRDLRAGGRGGKEGDGALEERSSGGASEGRGVRGWGGGGALSLDYG